jgi:hypothetical protein
VTVTGVQKSNNDANWKCGARRGDTPGIED